MKHTLLKSQADEVFILIKQFDFEPSHFKWGDVPSRTTHGQEVQMLRYKQSEFYFIFDFKYGQHCSEFSPGSEKVVEAQSLGGWQGQKVSVGNWLKFLKRELQTPNFWDTLKSSELTEEVLDTGEANAVFSQQEQIKIAESLQELKKYIIQSSQLSKAQLQALERQIVYLTDASTRLGRKDWYGILISVLFAQAVQLGLGADQVKTLFQIATQFFHWVVSNITYLS
jgi:hypothetical protein